MARFNGKGQVVYESVYWPEIPVVVVEEAKGLQQLHQDPSRVAAWKGNLPTALRSLPGTVVVRHTHSASDAPFAAVAAYQVVDGNVTHHFGAQGNKLVLPWEEVTSHGPHRKRP